MKGRWAKYVATGVMLAMLAACSSKPTDRGQQYKDGKFTQPFSLVNQPDAVGAPINAGDFAEQVNQIRSASPRLYTNQSNVYNAVQNWLRSGGDTRTMRQFGIDAWQMEGTDNYGNVQFTGYYTPVVQARHTRQGAFQYPIYSMPPKRGRLPSRAQIYAGALSDKYILAWSNSLMDNFIMDVQGSGYIDFGDGSPLNFFSYAGKNGWPYRSIGKVLIDRGEVKKKICRCRLYANGERSTAKRKCVNYWSRTRRSSSLSRNLCAGQRCQRCTADWASIRRLRPQHHSAWHDLVGGSTVAG